MTQSTSSGGLTFAGKFVVLLFIVACAGGAIYMLFGRQHGGGKGPDESTVDPRSGNGGAGHGNAVEIGVAYGTEKEHWLKAATEAFAQSPAGRGIRVNLIPMGSLEGAHAVEQKDTRIHVWAPASRLYKETFVTEWEGKNGTNPIGNDKAEPLALSPMVFVMWEERYEAFRKKYGELSFATIAEALAEPGGWGAIAKKADWGLFKFGHTHPEDSNSGLMTLVLMAYEYNHKQSGLSVGDITNAGFQKSMAQIEKSLSKPGGTLSNSTGTMMKEMVRFGPSYYDVVFVYESVALDNLKNAEGKWGTNLRVVYPALNSWNDNPFYILNVPWSTPAQREAAQTYLSFLLSDEMQRLALRDGFRPGSVSVPVNTPDSPVTANAQFGAKVEVNQLCEPPSAEVINNLLMSWERMMAR